MVSHKRDQAVHIDRLYEPNVIGARLTARLLHPPPPLHPVFPFTCLLAWIALTLLAILPAFCIVK